MQPASSKYFFNFLSERMEEGQRSVVEIYEKRMDILTKSVKKRKRNEMEKDDDDEFVSSVILHQEQVRNEVLYTAGYISGVSCYFFHLMYKIFELCVYALFLLEIERTHRGTGEQAENHRRGTSERR